MSLDSFAGHDCDINFTGVSYISSSIIGSAIDDVKGYLNAVLGNHCHTDNASGLSYYELGFLKSKNGVIVLSTLNLGIGKILHYYDDGVIIGDSGIARVDFNTLERKKTNFTRIFGNTQEKIEYRSFGENKKIIIGDTIYFISPDLHITSNHD